ncbi:MAG TPA: endonuclease/exonuclease/phosphatase family protein [Candidatus Binataceae bacterium]|nr:endonuclease/exonuclease/phosphatase family protein [Candidatus Binataceae bacterium]
MDGPSADLRNGIARFEPAYPPVVRNLAARPRRGPLRVVAFNAAGGARLDDIAHCLGREPLAGASIILLCEADWGTARSGRRKVALELADRLGMSIAYLPEFGRMGPGGETTAFMGNAILCAAPFEEVRAIAMLNPSPDGSDRMRRGYRGRFAGLAVRTKSGIAPGGPALWIGAAHLDSRCAPGGRAEQMAAYMDAFPAGTPAVFGGDLNSTTTALLNRAAYARTFAAMLLNPRRFRNPQRYEPMFAQLSAAGFEVAGANAPGRPTFTFSRLIPPLWRPRLDWIALRGVRPIADSAAVVAPRRFFGARRCSDHDFITVALDL